MPAFMLGIFVNKRNPKMLNELQLQNHYKGIGGTMASSLVGLNKFQSNIDAYLYSPMKPLERKIKTV